MKDDREAVMRSVRQALQEKPAARRVPLPEWEDARVVCKPPRAFASDEDLFRFKFEAAGGIVVEGFGALAVLLRERELVHGYCDPSIPFNPPDVTLAAAFERARMDDHEFAITRATLAIAETGSLVLTEAGSSSRLAALAPWVHVAVLERAAIVPDMPSAIARFGPDRAILLVTGPSKTADVEGILIQGVHGPGVQICCLV